MVFKFDHISYITSRSNKQAILCNKGEPLFKEINLKNIENKLSMMQQKQVDHDLYFFEEELPTEYIFYDSVFGDSKITVRNGCIYGYYSDMEETVKYLETFFPGKIIIHNDVIKCNMRGVIDKCDYYLILVYEPTIRMQKNFLDKKGYGVPAIIYDGNTSNVDYCTEERELIVNGKKMYIRFASSQYTNIVIELIRLNL